MSSSLLQVVNNLFQTCYNKLGTNNANTTCWQFVSRRYNLCVFMRVPYFNKSTHLLTRLCHFLTLLHFKKSTDLSDYFAGAGCKIRYLPDSDDTRDVEKAMAPGTLNFQKITRNPRIVQSFKSQTTAWKTDTNAHNAFNMTVSTQLYSRYLCEKIWKL